MPKTLLDWIRIAGEVKALQGNLKTAQADGKITIDEGIELTADVLGVLITNQVTLEELRDLVASIGPLLPLLKKLS